MKKTLCCVALCASFFLLRPTTGIACGDKYLVRYASVIKARMCLMAKPWAILLYRDSNIKATVSALEKDMLRYLQNAGLNVRVVESRQEFENAINNDVFDLILLGYSATEGAEKTLRDTGKKAKIVPVVDAENETEKSSAKVKYRKIIKDTDRTSTKLLIVSEVLLEADKK